MVLVDGEGVLVFDFAKRGAVRIDRRQKLLFKSDIQCLLQRLQAPAAQLRLNQPYARPHENAGTAYA